MNLPPIELLKSVHSFPGLYVFKIIIKNDTAIQSSVLSQIQKNLNLSSLPEFSSRTSENGKHASLTVEVVLPTAEHVHTVYQGLLQLPGVLLLL
jgi:putative lipoic acid-binding regulatory protein